MGGVKYKVSKERKAEIKRSAEYEANRCRRELDLGIEPISNIFEIIERQKILLLRYPCKSKSLSALLARDEEGFSMIYINSDMPLGRQIFSTAHEYAHFEYHLGNKNYWICEPGSPQPDDPEEIFADAFAARFLLPIEGVKRIFYEMFGTPKVISAFMVIRIQYIFKVSFGAMLYALLQAEIITSKTYGFLKKIGDPDQEKILEEYTRGVGLEPILMKPTAPIIPNALLHALQENYRNELISYNKVKSILANWRKKPEDYGLKYDYGI